MSSFVKLGDLTHIRTGKLDANASSENGQYPFFTCSKEPLRIASYSYDCECVLVAGNGDLNVKYYDGKFDAYQRTYIIESADKRKLLVKYMYFFLDIYVEVLRTQSIGGVIKYIKLGNLTDALIPLPSIERQAEIIECLEKCNTLIDKRQRQIALIEQTVKSRFIELFGMPGTDAFGWGLVPLGSTCNINPKKSLDSRLVSGAMVSFVPMPAVTEHGEIDATAIKEYDEVKTGFTYFAENDVLFAKITPCMENGKGAVAKGLHNGIGFGSTEFHVLRPLSGKTDPYWIYTLTAFSQFRIDAASNMTGSAGQRRVPASFLENYRVSLPPIELQEQFAAFVEQTDKSKYYSSLSFRYCQAAANTYRQEWMTCRTSDF